FPNAKMIAFGSTVNGHTDANEIDYFKFYAHKGDCIVIECEAGEIDSRLEPIFALRDSSGHELARSRSSRGLSFTLPDDEVFYAGLHDALYQGGPEFFYRFSIGVLPQIHSMRPISIESNDITKFRIIGHNLPGSEKGTDGFDTIEVSLSRTNSAVNKARFAIPAGAGLDLYEYRAQNEHGVSKPFPFAFPNQPLIAADQTNQVAITAQVIAPPCEIAGEFDRNRRSSWFTFEAKKGDTWWFELISQRLGSASDPLLVVQQVGKSDEPADVLELNDADENFGGIELNTKSRDPHGRFEAKANGTYRIEIKDLFTRNRESAPALYRLSIHRPQPDFRLVTIPSSLALPQKDSKEIAVVTTNLRRKSTVSVKVIALRQDGFNGPIDLSWEGLPKGVRSSIGRIDEGKSGIAVLLHGDESIENASSPVKLLGSAEISGTKTSHQAVAATLVWTTADFANERIFSRECSANMVSTIAETEPIHIFPLPEKTWEGTSTGKVSIALMIDRAPEFKMDTFAVTPIGTPALENMKEFEIAGTVTNTVFDIDLAQQKLAPGNYQFALRGFARGKRAKPPGPDPEYTVYSDPISLKVSAPPTTAQAK
ncbi:MAG: peptidase domain protein, partial [Verrucomicrobiales bacterium]|nr:peptidase domain protein [Verrucomicrobiales bacterium]